MGTERIASEGKKHVTFAHGFDVGVGLWLSVPGAEMTKMNHKHILQQKDKI
jgi:hypothetical protein